MKDPFSSCNYVGIIIGMNRNQASCWYLKHGMKIHTVLINNQNTII